MLVTKFYLMVSLQPGAKISLFCGEKGGIFQVKAENFPLAPVLEEVFCLFFWVMIRYY